MSEITYDDLKKRLDTIDHNVLAAISRIERVDKKLDVVLIALGVKEDIDEKEYDEPKIDKLAHLRALESMEGRHEIKDRDWLIGRFGAEGIKDHRGEDFDPSVNPWCGAGLRLACVMAGLADPGLEYNKASNWANYGEECDPSEPGAILVHHTHVGIRTEDGGEIGCNVTNSVKVGQDTWFGEVIAARKPLYV